MRVAVLANAENDLLEIGDWIAQDSNERAISFVRELRMACEAIGDLPCAYPLLPRYEQTQIRRKPYRSYLIFYWIKNDVVEVLHILHAARNYGKILFPEE